MGSRLNTYDDWIFETVSTAWMEQAFWLCAYYLWRISQGNDTNFLTLWKKLATQKHGEGDMFLKLNKMQCR